MTLDPITLHNIAVLLGVECQPHREHYRHLHYHPEHGLWTESELGTTKYLKRHVALSLQEQPITQGFLTVRDVTGQKLGVINVMHEINTAQVNQHVSIYLRHHGHPVVKRCFARLEELSIKKPFKRKVKWPINTLINQFNLDLLSGMYVRERGHYLFVITINDKGREVECYHRGRHIMPNVDTLTKSLQQLKEKHPKQYASFPLQIDSKSNNQGYLIEICHLNSQGLEYSYAIREDHWDNLREMLADYPDKAEILKVLSSASLSFPHQQRLQQELTRLQRLHQKHHPEEKEAILLFDLQKY